MNKKLVTLVIGVLAVAGSSARAVEGLSGSAAVTGAVSGKDEQSPKFREYWYDMRSGFGLSPELTARYEATLGGLPIYADGEINGRTGILKRSTEGDAGVDVGSYGIFKVYGSFERIGHQFAHDAKTLYDGLGTDRMTLNDASFRSAQEQTTVSNARTALLWKAEETARIVDIGLRRDIVKAGVDLAALEPFTVSINFDGEQRRGARPFGALFGSSPGAMSVVEVAEPINYDTANVSARIGYAGELPVVNVPLAADVSAGISNFTNNFESLSIDNPFILTDSKTGGPAMGRWALAPSNSANTVGANLSTVLPGHVGVAGHASISTLTQNEELLPFTSNSIFATIYSDMVFPRTTADAKVVNSLYKGSVSYSPVSRLHLMASLSQRQHDNQTEEFVPARVVVGDTATQLNNSSEYVQFTTRQVEVEQVIDLGHRSHLITAFENEHETFTDGSSPLMSQNLFKVAVDTRAIDWASIRVSGSHAVRDSAYPNYTSADGELPWNRKFYAAARDRDQMVVMTTLSVIENTDISLQHTQGTDNYPQTEFGLQKEDHQASTVDVTYSPDPTLTVNSFYTMESYRLHQRSRQWNPSGATPGTGDPYGQIFPWNNPGVESPSNWDADATTVINTIGLSTDMQLVPDRLTAHLEGTGSVTRGRVDFSSMTWTAATTTTPFDNNAFIPADFPNVDSSRSLSAGLSLACVIIKSVVGTLGYRYDLWEYQDDLLKDAFPMPIATNPVRGYNNLITMGIIPRNYEVHTVYAKVSTNF